MTVKLTVSGLVGQVTFFNSATISAKKPDLGAVPGEATACRLIGLVRRARGLSSLHLPMGLMTAAARAELGEL